MTARAAVVPLSLRVAYEVLASRSWSLWVGLGGAAAYVRVGFGDSTAERWGFGGLGFASGTFPLGPGQAFVELSGAWVPVRSRSFYVEAGGATLVVGYRLGLLR